MVYRIEDVLAPEQVEYIRLMYENGEAMKPIAKSLAVGYNSILAMARRLNWDHDKRRASRKCECCGKLIPANAGVTAKYCSLECRRAIQYQRERRMRLEASANSAAEKVPTEYKKSVSSYKESVSRKPREMHETSIEYCKKCAYQGNRSCDYLIMTKERRNCPVGYCDKFTTVGEYHKMLELAKSSKKTKEERKMGRPGRPKKNKTPDIMEDEKNIDMAADANYEKYDPTVEESSTPDESAVVVAKNATADELPDPVDAPMDAVDASDAPADTADASETMPDVIVTLINDGYERLRDERNTCLENAERYRNRAEVIRGMIEETDAYMAEHYKGSREWR
jgi:hypothetical protein